MILSAQSRGENINSLLSGDYKQFCDEVIEAIRKKTRKEKLIYILDTIFLCLAILIGTNIFIFKDFIGIVKALFTKVTVNRNISFSLGTLVSMLAIIAAAVTLIQMICKKVLNKTANTLRLVVRTFALRIIFRSILWFEKNIVLTVNFFAACTVALVFFVIHRAFDMIGNLS